MTEDKWISSDARTQKLVIRFWVKGFPKQFFISTGLKDTKRNREIVRSKREAIANDIALERFDPSLINYQFRLQKQQPPVITQHSISDLWEKFTDFQKKQLEETTIRDKYKVITARIEKFPSQWLEDASIIRDWLLCSYSHFSAWETLAFLNRCCDWAVRSEITTINPGFLTSSKKSIYMT